MFSFSPTAFSTKAFSSAAFAIETLVSWSRKFVGRLPWFSVRYQPSTDQALLLPKRAYLYSAPVVKREAAFDRVVSREVRAPGYWAHFSKSYSYQFSVDGPIIVRNKDFT